MSKICWYFQLHQPWRLRPYSVFDVGVNHDYFAVPDSYDFSNKLVMHKVAEKSYRPMLSLLHFLVQKYPEFVFTLSLSGVFLEQAQEFTPDIIEKIRALVETGQVELLAETYSHSLSALHSSGEFESQVAQHGQLLQELFLVKPKVFRNTELVYSNEIAQKVQKMGYTAMLAEGADHILEWRSPTKAYHAVGMPEFPVFLKHYKLADDVAFRFSQQSWAGWPLSAPTYAHWLTAPFEKEDVIGLFMDFETFGEHQWAETGIFSFFEHLIAELDSMDEAQFVTPSMLQAQRAQAKSPSSAPFDAPNPVSWADVDRDLTAWLGNPLQHDAFRALYELEDQILASGDPQLLADWRKLQTSDHFYYMCTKWANDGDVHAYFSPYRTPYDAYTTYNNVLADMKWRLDR